MTQMAKLSIKEKIGYAIASTGDSIYYTIIGTFLMFFFTTVAGIDPKIAGILTGIGAIWNAIFNPIIGYISDRTATKYGRRRPLMMGFSIPLTVVAVLLFTNFSMPHAVKSIVYGILIILYRSFFTGFYVPYLALGASYTNDYKERTELRLYASLFNMVGNVFSMFLPTMLVNFLSGDFIWRGQQVGLGLSVNLSWSVTAAILAGVSLGATLVTFITSKEKDPPCTISDIPDTRGFSLSKLLGEYVSIIKLKPVMYLIALSLTTLIGYSILMADMMYFFTYNMGFSAGKISLLLVLRPILGSLIIPVIAKLISVIDKKWTIILYLATGVVLLTVLRITGIYDGPLLILYIFALMCGTYNYWQIVPSMYYDVCEYDKLVNQRDRQGTIISFQGMLESISAGLGTFILGLILGASGFDGNSDVQTQTALDWIFNCTTLVPCIFFVIAAIVMIGYPLTKEKYAEILDEMDASR